MARYISLITFTQEGITNIKEAPERLSGARSLLRDLGGELRDFYLTMGAYDIIVVIEAPTDEVVARFALAVGGLGNVRTNTFRAFTEEEYRSLVSSLP